VSGTSLFMAQVWWPGVWPTHWIIFWNATNFHWRGCKISNCKRLVWMNGVTYVSVTYVSKFLFISLSIQGCMLQWKYCSMLLPYGWSQISFPNLVVVFLPLVFSGYVGLLPKIVCIQSIKCMPSSDAKVSECMKIQLHVSDLLCLMAHFLLGFPAIWWHYACIPGDVVISHGILYR
jgi:hypothetical protein